jgi:hypothetical protein
MAVVVLGACLNSDQNEWTQSANTLQDRFVEQQQEEIDIVSDDKIATVFAPESPVSGGARVVWAGENLIEGVFDGDSEDEIISDARDLTLAMGWNASTGLFALSLGGVKSVKGPILEPVNARGDIFPDIIDPRTGQKLSPPPADLVWVEKANRVPWSRELRSEFIREWARKGYRTPPGGWPSNDLHHIIPREWGGTNDFWNLVPVLKETHRTILNRWWNAYVSMR